MSNSYSYKSSSSGPAGSSYSYESSGPQGHSSYSYKSSSSSTSGQGQPMSHIGGDADFQAAKMQAMMGGAPMGANTGNAGSYSYSYKSSSGSSGGTNAPLHVSGGSQIDMDAEMERMRREAGMGMNPGMTGGTGGNSYSYSSQTSSSGGSIPLHQPENHLSGSSTKKVITTTTTRTNPQAAREFEALERDFSKIGRTPENYHDDFDKLKREVLSGEAYKGETTTHQTPIVTKFREEHTKSSRSNDSTDGHSTVIPVVDHSRAGSGHHGSSTTTTTTTRTYSAGGGPTVTEEKVTKTSSSGLHQKPESSQHFSSSGETFIPISTYDNNFDTLHMNRFMDHRDQFHAFPDLDFETQKMAWNNQIGNIRSGFFAFPSHHGNSSLQNVESSKTVSKTKKPLRRTQSCKSSKTYYMDCLSKGKNPVGRPEFSVQFDMQNFKPEDINITTKFGKLIIKATHEEKSGGSVSRREFSRTVDLPSDVQVNLMRSVYSRDGVLSITAPISQVTYNYTPPAYTPRQNSYTSTADLNPASSFPYKSADQNESVTELVISHPPIHQSQSSPRMSSSNNIKSTSNTTTSYNNQLVSTGNHNEVKPAFNPAQNFSHTVPVAGFKPQDLNITIEGRKVKIHGKHQETTPLGRSTYNEFRKMFDLHSSVDTSLVQAYIKNSHTLYIAGNVNHDELEGDIDFIEITRKA